MWRWPLRSHTDGKLNRSPSYPRLQMPNERLGGIVNLFDSTKRVIGTQPCADRQWRPWSIYMVGVYTRTLALTRCRASTRKRTPRCDRGSSFRSPLPLAHRIQPWRFKCQGYVAEVPRVGHQRFHHPMHLKSYEDKSWIVQQYPSIGICLRQF